MAQLIFGELLCTRVFVWQERILKGEYGDGEHFTYSYGLVFMNRFLGFLFSAVMLHYTRPKW